MKKNISLMIVGVLIGAILFGGATVIANTITAEPTPFDIFVDGVPVSVEAYIINGNNYMKLRDLCKAIDIGVWYEPDEKNVYIESDKSYDPDYDGTSYDTSRYVLALIIDDGRVDDGSYNQSAWEGIVRYATEKKLTHKYYRAIGHEDAGYLEAIDLAVKGGAKIIVTLFFTSEVAVYYAQDKYPDVKFIILDGIPNNGDFDAFDSWVGDNTVAISFAEEQSGFLAGYAAVMDGYRKLGFMGGMQIPAIIRYGYGYIQGADVAARELGLEGSSVSINYYYTGTFSPDPSIQTIAAKWYNEGVEVIFSVGGGNCEQIFKAAENSGNAVIGVGRNQSDDSPVVITSAITILEKPVYDCISSYYNDSFPGGKTLLYSAENLGVGLPMDSSKFKTFDQSQYETIYSKLQNGTVKVNSDFYGTADQVKTSIVKVICIY